MFPVNAIPTFGNTKFQVFYASGTDWQAWQKPAGCSMVYIFMLAAGGGGARVSNGTAGNAAGGGGGSGGASRMLIPALLLPDTIWVQPGAGGLGATTQTTDGGNGATSYVAVQPNTTQANIIFTQIGGGGGFSNRNGGTAGAIGVNTGGPFGSLGLWYSIAGQVGANGASALNGNGGTSVFGSNGLITTSGGSGGNGTGAGGGITGAGLVPTIPNSAGTVGTNGGVGFQKGLVIQQGLKNSPLFFTGGAGGGGHSTGTAGKGGDAAYGGGGGGGGGCSGAGTSGNGGNGGDGFIIIGTF